MIMARLFAHEDILELAQVGRVLVGVVVVAVGGFWTFWSWLRCLWQWGLGGGMRARYCGLWWWGVGLDGWQGIGRRTSTGRQAALIATSGTLLRLQPSRRLTSSG